MASRRSYDCVHFHTQQRINGEKVDNERRHERVSEQEARGEGDSNVIRGADWERVGEERERESSSISSSRRRVIGGQWNTCIPLQQLNLFHSRSSLSLSHSPAADAAFITVHHHGTHTLSIAPLDKRVRKERLPATLPAPTTAASLQLLLRRLQRLHSKQALHCTALHCTVLCCAFEAEHRVERKMPCCAAAAADISDYCFIFHI